VASNGVVTLVFPNEYDGNNRLKAGRIYEGQSWGLHVDGTLGRERLVLLVATDERSLPGVTKFRSGEFRSGEDPPIVSKNVSVFGKADAKSEIGGVKGKAGASVVEFFTEEK
jgi:hypothetical protein